MIINHNMGALNANRQMNINSASANKSMEKLSSGLRINKAGDDAAGLAISEKMRGQIRGLDQASANSQDAISLIQTGEGALNETHSILQRMRELAVQSATDTNTADDRSKIQSETDQLAKEITRISNTTQFNTQNLLAGGLNDTFQIGANKDQNIQLNIGAMDAQTLGVAGTLIGTSVTAANGVTGISEVTSSLGAGAEVSVVAVNAATYTPAGGSIAGALTNNASAYTGATDLSFQIRIDSVALNEATAVSFSKDGGTTWTSGTQTAAGQFSLSDGVAIDINAAALNAAGQIGTMAVTAKTVTMKLDNGAGNIGSTVTVRSNQSSITLGDASTGQTANVAFTFNSLAAGVAGISQTSTASTVAVTDANGNVTTQAVAQKGINVSTKFAANNAVQTIDDAIKTVSSERSKLGAYQNRLEHTIANLGTSSENLTSAESRIRDVDMAKEMSTFSKNNILSQAAQAMLAQANQQPQQVLQLLR
jgi:flagellin